MALRRVERCSRHTDIASRASPARIRRTRYTLGTRFDGCVPAEFGRTADAATDAFGHDRSMDFGMDLGAGVDIDLGDELFGDLTTLSGPAMYGVLAVLALIDSTSFGTLLIPIWLMLAPGRLRPGRMLLYLGTIYGFYLILGILLALGASAIVEVAEAADSW